MRRLSSAAFRTPHSVLLAGLFVLSLLSTANSQQPPSGPAELLERFDIGPSQIESFFSGQPLSPAEEDVLLKILYRFLRLGLDNLQRWRQTGFAWDQLVAAPAEHRTQVFHLSGRVKHVEAVRILPEQAELYEFNHYYRVRLALTGSTYEAVVAARRIPAAWNIEAPLDEPVRADAMFLKVGDEAADPPQLLFVADRLGWYPDRPDEKNHIGPSQLALAKLGMDISQWDDVHQSKDRGLSGADREGFYQLLAMLGRPEARDLGSQTAALDLVALLEKPVDNFGTIAPIQGLARRVMKVPVSDADIRSRFGIDHYYEIDLFLPLGDTSLRFGNDPSGEKNPVYRNKFPATLIVRNLPPGFPEGDTIHELVAADGVFFKIWNYRSNYTGQFGQLQPAPLFIASTARIVPTSAAQNWVTSGLVLAAFALALGVVVVIAWIYGRDDRAAKRSLTKDKTGIRPDFSRFG